MARGKKTGLPEPAGIDQASAGRDIGDRQARADHLIAAIAACDWRDAEVILSAFLEEYRLGPPLPALLDIEEETAFWAYRIKHCNSSRVMLRVRRNPDSSMLCFHNAVLSATRQNHG